MRISYGIFGYGRGHATRTAAILPDLTARHDVQIFAGGDAYDALWSKYPIVRIPTLGYAYTEQAKRSNWLTLKQNGWHVLDMLFHGPTFQLMKKEMLDFRPDVVISDAEPWTHCVARHLGIPRIGFDHFGVMVYCQPRIPLGDRIRSRRDVAVYRLLMGRPQRIIVSSFYNAPTRYPGVRVIGPMLRDEVLRLTPTRGAHLLAYFNKGEHQYTPHVRQALRGLNVPVLIYGTPRVGQEGLLTYRPPSNLPFLEDLASCRAVISTAGNQLVGETLHLRKPMLVMPEDCVEQRLNAANLARMGIGMEVRHREFTGDVVRAFLADEPRYLANINKYARDGRREALETIEQFLVELVGPERRTADPRPREKVLG